MSEQVVAKSAKTVSMGCKLPNGLRMRLFQMHTEKEAVMGGGVRDVQRARQKGTSIVIRGSSRERQTVCIITWETAVLKTFRRDPASQSTLARVWPRR